jgi:hypothetical protein
MVDSIPYLVPTQFPGIRFFLQITRPKISAQVSSLCSTLYLDGLAMKNTPCAVLLKIKKEKKK